jgi:pSer/pThr/pTyr-binding forkhead associated (FHA) protein
MTPTITLTRLTGFGRGKKETFNREMISLGTDSACELRLDPTWDKTVSPKHLTLEWQTNSLWLVDVSKAGTFVRGQKVSRAAVEPGAEIELGQGGPKIKVDFTPLASAQPLVTHSPPPPGASRARPPELGVPAPAVAAPFPTHGKQESKRGIPGWIWAFAAVVMVALIAGGVWYTREEPPERALATAASNYSDAVALVVLVSDGQSEPIATAWAIGPRLFATNSHVTTPVAEILRKGGSVYLVINRKPDRKLKVTKAVIHPRYAKPELSFEGKQAAVPAYDVGLLYTDEDAPKILKLAPRAELERLDSGYRIGFLGFPMEGISGGGVDVHSPVATMQSGIVTSTTDFWLAQAGFEKRLLVQHNMGSAGGASGSPIFNSRGEVVAILSAGNIIGQVSVNAGKISVIRAPSAAMVNYAQRVDILADIWPEYPK